MPTALPYILAGAQVLQGIQGYQQNQAMADATAAAAEANIKNEQQALKLKQTQLRREQELARGKQTVAAAGSGATLGSFDYLFEDTMTQQLLDKAMLDYDSKMTQENIRYNAAISKAEYKSAARSSLISGITSAAGTLYTVPSAQKAATSASNYVGQKVGSVFSSSKTGPYLNYGSSILS